MGQCQPFYPISKRIFHPSGRFTVYVSLVLLIAGLGFFYCLADMRSPDGPAADDISGYLVERPL